MYRGNGEMRFQYMGVMEKDFCPNFLQPFLEHIVTTEAGSLLQYFTTLSYGGGSHFVIPSKGGFLGRVECEV